MLTQYEVQCAVCDLPVRQNIIRLKKKSKQTHQQRAKNDGKRFFSCWRETRLCTSTVGQIKNTIQEVGVSVSKSTTKRTAHRRKCGGCSTRCFCLVNLKNRKTVIKVCPKKTPIFISPYRFGTVSYRQMSQRSTCSRMMRRDKDEGGKKVLVIWVGEGGGGVKSC